MVAQAISAIGRQRKGRVIGGSRSLDGSGGGAFQRHGGLDGGVEAGDLAGLTLGLGGSGGSLLRGGGDRGLGAVEPSPVEAERIPAEAETAEDDGSDGEDEDAEGQPAHRRQGPQDRRQADQGNTRRSSSKCGPSRRRGQSPPQTRATPFAFAADLMASAMRG